VFQFDDHWNPAAVQQALDRAVRLGNHFEQVNLVNFTCENENSLDSVIQTHLQQKMDWFKLMVDNAPECSQPKWLVNIYRERLLAVSEFSAEKKAKINEVCDRLITAIEATNNQTNTRSRSSSNLFSDADPDATPSMSPPPAQRRRLNNGDTEVQSDDGYESDLDISMHR